MTILVRHSGWGTGTEGPPPHPPPSTAPRAPAGLLRHLDPGRSFQAVPASAPSSWVCSPCSPPRGPLAGPTGPSGSGCPSRQDLSSLSLPPPGLWLLPEHAQPVPTPGPWHRPQAPGCTFLSRALQLLARGHPIWNLGTALAVCLFCLLSLCTAGLLSYLLLYPQHLAHGPVM